MADLSLFFKDFQAKSIAIRNEATTAPSPPPTESSLADSFVWNLWQGGDVDDDLTGWMMITGWMTIMTNNDDRDDYKMMK